jgi:putative phosphoribosyl transferase
MIHDRQPTMQTLATMQHRTSGFPRIDAEARYADRIAAGRGLAQLLLRYHASRAQVLALPPGGVIVAGEVARVLRLSLDVLVAREIVIRPYPALVAGGLSEGGGLCLNRAVLRLPGASRRAFWPEARRTMREITALVEQYRQGRPLPPLQQRIVCRKGRSDNSRLPAP